WINWAQRRWDRSYSMSGQKRDADSELRTVRECRSSADAHGGASQRRCVLRPPEQTEVGQEMPSNRPLTLQDVLRSAQRTEFVGRGTELEDFRHNLALPPGGEGR